MLVLKNRIVELIKTAVLMTQDFCAVKTYVGGLPHVLYADVTQTLI